MKSIIWLGEKLAMLVKRYKKAAITAFILLFIFNYSAIGSVVKEKDKKEILNKAYTLKIPFIENKGQIKGESVKYFAKTFGGAVFVTKDGKLVYSLPKFEKKEKVKGWVIKESLVGASISNVKGERKAVTKVSYFKGKDPSNWKRDISTYNLVSLGEVYKRIELKVKAYGKNVEKLFYVKAGANPESIKIKIEGAKSLRVNENGELEVETGLGVVKFTKPVAYQEINGKRVKVAAAYTLLSNPQYVYGFKVGSYDKKETLIIDPLLASTFIGGSDVERVYSIALDGGGNVYITGGTRSSDYPTTSGTYDESFNGGYWDVFVSKLDSSLSSLLASTFIGGGGNEIGYSIALDGGGNVYITGETQSSNYPTTSGAYDESHNGGNDVFVSKLDSSLSTLLASTFIGGSGSGYWSYDCGYSIALDGGGNVYITGRTYSSNYPTTSGAYDESHNGGDDVFVSKLDSSLSNLLASTFIGGSYYDYGNSIALDGGGNVYITGRASHGYPITPGAYDESHHNEFDVFVSKLDSSLSNLLASTFIGGSNSDYGQSIALDGGGNVYVTGRTYSSDYPTTPGAYDESHNGGDDVFVSKLDSSLSNLLASTFIGGSSYYDYGNSIVLDGGGNVYITGRTESSDYPTTPGAYDESLNGYYDVFVSKLDSSLSSLLASTFIGGSGGEWGNSIALDGGGNVYVTGETNSSDYPTTPGAYLESYKGNGVFVSKLDSNLTSFPYSLKTVGWEIVGSDGGTVLVTDTSSEILGAQVEIPADALSEDTIIAISELVEEIPPFPEDIIGIGLPVHFGPEGLVFNKPGTIKIPYTEEDLENAGVSDPQELNVYTFNTTTLTWELVEGPKTVDEENMLIMIDVTHFSIFQLGVRKVAVQGDLDGDGDVDLDDLNILLTHRNQPASACPKCDIDGDGVITVLDARKLVLMCTRPRCACE
ncbi:Beta-propeller repeat protein [Candidatus Methanoperedenaceae archaeon GB50]|nr:Beta-propeller repeat protein [Candidatus Methanoperedenaceae archaeon GB50]